MAHIFRLSAHFNGPGVQIALIFGLSSHLMPRDVQLEKFFWLSAHFAAVAIQFESIQHLSEQRHSLHSLKIKPSNQKKSPASTFSVEW
ncbi:hypothetical protein [Lacicoccus qingdaonensis]|uniref:hypothetical protein n=1 Tax=Lacicoccus qingdaonensis TaxID=576118 RepID=UPI00115F83E2|nr:hypothetical protein [Salinicoccus qingdaonensis]